jgi:CHAT domain-containing protein/tetratricopeptide (TPR) repeat protein
LRRALRIAALLLPLASPPGPAETPALTPGLRLEESLAGGESRRYPVELKAGDLLSAVVVEEGIDVVVRLRTPGGAELVHVDGPNRPREDEELAAIAPQDGVYQLEVSSNDRSKPSGCYVLRIEDLRPADDRGRLLAQAVALTQEAVEQMQRQDRTGWRLQLATRERTLALWRSLGDGARAANALLQMGELRKNLEEQEAAADLLHQAVDGFRAAADRPGLAEALNEAGLVDVDLRRPAEAMAHFDEALPLARSAADDQLEVLLLNNLGTAYLGLGRSREALQPLAASRDLAHRIGDAVGEALALDNLGSAHADLADRQLALVAYRGSLAIAHRAGLRSIEAAALNNLGYSHETLGLWEEARSEQRRALALFCALEERHHEAQGLGNLALVSRRLGRYREAADYSARAIALAHALGDRDLEALATTGLAFLDLERGKPARALAAAESARNLAPAGGEAETYVWHAVGAARRATGDLPGAAAALARAVAASRAHGDRTAEANADLFLAQTARDGGDLDRAAELAREALDIVESLRTRVASKDLRSSFTAIQQRFYELAIDALMQLDRARPGKGFAARAFTVAERARARSLLEILAEAGAEPGERVDPQLARRELGARRAVSAAELHRQSLLRGAAPPAAAEIAAATREVEATLGAYGEVEAELADESPSYASLVEPQPLSAAEVGRQVLDPDTLLLEFALGKERSYLWALADGDLTSYELPPRAAVEAAARRVYERLTAVNRAPKAETPPARRMRLERAARELPAAARALSRMLLAPAAGRLGHRRLAVVADGLLQYIPFVALPDPSAGTGLPLVAAHEVVTLPSASALAVLRRELAGRAPAPLLLAVLADPVLGRDDPRVERPPARGRGRKAGHGADFRGGEESAALLPLHFSRREAESIAALVPASERLVAMGFDASRTTALSGQLARYRIVHFATHGQIDSGHPALSSLVLSLVDRRGRPQDGFLRLADVYGMVLHADLVVLSACRTALGKDVRGEGLIGLTRGFMHAGSPRVLASLWSVDDRATAELMQRLYRSMLAERMTPAAALRAAQLSMARDPRWASPYYWAGFSLEGEWR